VITVTNAVVVTTGAAVSLPNAKKNAKGAPAAIRDRTDTITVVRGNTVHVRGRLAGGQMEWIRRSPPRWTANSVAVVREGEIRTVIVSEIVIGKGKETEILNTGHIVPVAGSGVIGVVAKTRNRAIRRRVSEECLINMKTRVTWRDGQRETGKRKGGLTSKLNLFSFSLFFFFCFSPSFFSLYIYIYDLLMVVCFSFLDFVRSYHRGATGSGCLCTFFF
jgi:hypothetical protein